MSLKAWLHSLVAAAISAAASGVTVSIVAPESFNFSGPGLQKLGELCAISALISVANFLKQSPLPSAEVTTTTTAQVTTTVEGTTKP
jgi:hypothetical protein